MDEKPYAMVPLGPNGELGLVEFGTIWPPEVDG